MKKLSTLLQHESTSDSHKKTPLYHHIQQLDASQRRAIGALYVIASKSWIKSKKKKFKMIDFLSEKDQKELMTLLELNDVPPEGFLVKLQSKDLRWMVLWHYLNFVLLEEKKYDSRMRTSLLTLAHEMEIDPVEVAEGEYKIGLQLQHAMRELESLKTHKKSSASSGRWWKVGGAALIGGGLIALTGGLAAPVIIPALTALIGLVAVGGTALGIGGGVVVLTGAATGIITFGGIPLVAGVFGLAGGGLAAYKLDYRLRGITHFKFTRLESNEQARILLCINEKMKREQEQLTEEMDRIEKEKKTGIPQPTRVQISEENVDCLSKEVAEGTVCYTHKLSGPAPQQFSGPLSTTTTTTVSESLRHEEDKLLQDIKTHHKGMQVFIGVWGCLNYHMYNEKIGAREFAQKWKDLGVCAPFAEHYALEWEPRVLSRLGHAIRDFVLSHVGSQIFHLWLTAVSSAVSVAMSAVLGPLIVLKAFTILNNPWSIAVNRAVKTGKVLSAVLKERAQGNRPVTLIGVGLGARVIFDALYHLSQQGEAGLGIVENVFLIGAAVESHSMSKWQGVRKVVSGRLVNAFCRKDWVLAFLFRSMELSASVAGLAPVPHSNVENICLDDLCNGYSSYEDPAVFRKVLRKLKLMRGLQLPEEVPEEKKIEEESTNATEDVKETNAMLDQMKQQNANKTSEEILEEIQNQAKKLATEDVQIQRSENQSEFATKDDEDLEAPETKESEKVKRPASGERKRPFLFAGRSQESGELNSVSAAAHEQQM